MSLKKTFKVVTLGCRTNQYESQAYADQLKAVGYTEVSDGETAEVCIVNTCTVTESADSSSRHAIRELARKHPGSKLVVTGCLAESHPEQIRSIEGVTDIVPNPKKESLLPVVFPEQEWPEFSIQQFDEHTRAFVKVQDGCNSFCTYCVIPYVRGRSRSRSMEDIEKEVRDLIANGYKEIVLTGINIGDYDGGIKGGSVKLADLVRAVDKIEGLKRLRLSSIDPDEVDEDLQSAILEGKTTCHSLHIVLQSGSNVVLKRMNRKYTRQIFFETIYRLRAADPDFGFTTDVIVGFPGETEADYNDTLDVMSEVKFAKVHMFPYSARPRTRAALYPNQVPHAVIQERKAKILQKAEEYAFNWRETFVGRSMIALLESPSAAYPGYFSGHTDNFLSVLVPAEGRQRNELLEVKFMSNTPSGLLCTSI